jgi:hypothetical protein
MLDRCFQLNYWLPIVIIIFLSEFVRFRLCLIRFRFRHFRFRFRPTKKYESENMIDIFLTVSSRFQA